MPLYKIAPPEGILYRGHFMPQKKGDILQPCARTTAAQQDTGRFVFASHHTLHALAYGLKGRSTAIHWCYYADELCCYAVVGLENGQNGTEKDSYEKLCAEVTYLQTLSTQGFQAVFSARPSDGDLPEEWVSQEPVEILHVDIIKNEEALRRGLQLLTLDNHIFEVLHDQKKFGFDAYRKLFDAKLLEWVNLRPVFDGAPLARSYAMARLLGCDSLQSALRAARPTSVGGAFLPLMLDHD